MWHAETDPAANRVLAERWPGVPNLGDITTVDWHAVPDVDWLTAGYPCQGFSDAGKRLGVQDDRYLWPEVARAIRVVRPRFVLVENVPGHVRRGFTNVLNGLAAFGYLGSWVLVRASDVGACHRRERLFAFAADAAALRKGAGWPTLREGRERSGVIGGGTTTAGIAGAHPVLRLLKTPTAQLAVNGGSRHPDERRAGGHGPTLADEVERLIVEDPDGPYAPALAHWAAVVGRSAPSPVDRIHGAPPALAPRFEEWMMGLSDGYVTAVPGIGRSDAYRLLGNGVVPQQAAHAIRLLLARHTSAAACVMAAAQP